MRDCPSCRSQVDGLWCKRCGPPATERVGPPGGFAALYAKCAQKPRDRDAEEERRAIQAEGA